MPYVKAVTILKCHIDERTEYNYTGIAGMIGV